MDKLAFYGSVILNHCLLQPSVMGERMNTLESFKVKAAGATNLLNESALSVSQMAMATVLIACSLVRNWPTDRMCSITFYIYTLCE